MINRILTPPGVVPIIIVQQSDEDQETGWCSLRKLRTDDGKSSEIRLSAQTARELVHALLEGSGLGECEEVVERVDGDPTNNEVGNLRIRHKGRDNS